MGNKETSDKTLQPYLHLAKYYETDKMAVIHHSNYIRWFEEARVDFLEQIGMSFEKIESEGLYSPVLSAFCEYKMPVRFNEAVYVLPKLEFFNGIKMTIGYKVIDVATKQIKATGETKHCFITTDFKPVSLKKEHKNIYDKLLQWTGVEVEI